MTDKTITSLTAIGALDGTELLNLVQGGNSRKGLLSALKTFCSASPTLVTPILGIATATSLAIGGATIGGNALAVTGRGAVDGGFGFTQGVTLTGLEGFSSAAGALARTISTRNSRIDNIGLTWGSTYQIGWTSVTPGTGSDAAATPDLIILRDAANTLAQRNGVNAQTFNIYNTWTDASNYERGGLVWSSNQLLIGTAKAGTGSARLVAVGSNLSGNPDAVLALQGTQINFYGTGGINPWAINTSGHLISPTDNTYDIGASAATSPRSIYFGTSIFRGSTKILGAQGAAVADASGGTIIDIEARAALNALLARERAHGLIAT